MSEFGPLLKHYRERANLSQAKLAGKAKFDHSYLSRLEQSARQPTRDAVERLADALKLSAAETDELVTAAGFVPASSFSLATVMDIRSRLIEALRVIDNERVGG